MSVGSDVETASAAPVKPRLRGVSHQYAFFASLLSGGALVAMAPTRRALAMAVVYGVSVSALFGASALYHRVTWSKSRRRWMARLDHSMINVLIAGTYTPFGVLAMSGTLAVVLLYVVWGGALVSTVIHLLWVDVPKWLSALLYVVLGWVGVVAMPQLVTSVGWPPTVLLFAGGLLYSVGAAVYALRRPDPAPAVFGYHEIFHALVVVAALVHYVAVAMTVLPG
jgi:hemolysin III